MFENHEYLTAVILGLHGYKVRKMVHAWQQICKLIFTMNYCHLWHFFLVHCFKSTLRRTSVIIMTSNGKNICFQSWAIFCLMTTFSNSSILHFTWFHSMKSNDNPHTTWSWWCNKPFCVISTLTYCTYSYI